MVKGAEHIGVSVVCLERSIEFYCTGFGMELTEQDTFEGERYERILGLKGARGKVALLRTSNLRLELFEFLYPLPNPRDPLRPVSDHGISHFCVEVTDIQSAYERLRAAGASFHCPPLEFFDTTLATYGRDPDGNVFELLEVKEAGLDRRAVR